jgi:hypothetical protein
MVPVGRGALGTGWTGTVPSLSGRVDDEKKSHGGGLC